MGFETIILALDNDEAGIGTARKLYKAFMWFLKEGKKF